MAIQHINIGAAPNDKTGTPARQAGQIINSNFDYLDGKISNKNQVITYGTFVLVGQVLTIHAGWVWMINGQQFTNPVDVQINYPYAATGLQRLDRVVFNTSNTFSRNGGPESVSNPIAVAPLPDTIEFGVNLVTDSTVGDPSAPIIGDEYVQKNESQDYIINYGSTTVIEQVDLYDNRSSLSITNVVADIKSLNQISTEFIRLGKPFFLKNRSGHDVKLWHNAGTGNIKFNFSDGLDLIIKPNEVLQFSLNANDSSNNRLELVGFPGVDLSDYYNKSEIDSKISSVLIYKGSVPNYASLPSTGLAIGHVYNLSDTGHNYAWTGSVWDDLGPAVDISAKEDVSNKSNDIEGDKLSTSKYGSISAWITWLKNSFISNLPAKGSELVDADLIIAGDSADSFKTKTRTFAQLKATLLAYFDTKYSSINVPTPKGYIYNKNSWVNLNDFNILGNATASISSGKIIIGTSVAGGYNDAITLKTPTGLGKFKITCEIKVINTIGTTTYGIGLGIKSLNGISANKFQTLARLDMSSTVSKGYVYIDYGGNTYTNAVTNNSAFNFSLNDVLRFVLEQDLDKFTLTVFNITTGLQKITSLTYVVSNVQPFPSNTGDFAIHIFGGSYEMSLFKVESKEWKNAKLLCVGDSKTNGFNGDSFSKSFVQQLDFFYRGIHDNSGGNDRTDEVLLKIPEIISFSPKKVLLNIGSNDKRNGTSLGTWSANYSSIVTQLQNAGIEVFHLLQLNEGTLTFSDYNSYITTNYPASNIIDAGIVPLEQAAKVHPNQSGMDQVFTAIISQIGDKII